MQVWGRTLQSGEESVAVYLPLGLPPHNSRKQADILLALIIHASHDSQG